MTPTVGRQVHYRIGGTDEAPELRAATVVCVFTNHPDGPRYVHCNLQVQLDGLNDLEDFTREECDRGLAWRTSVFEGTGVGEWRWPARA